MNIDPDTLQEIKDILEYALENRSWPAVEEAVELLKENLGYELDETLYEEESGEE